MSGRDLDDNHPWPLLLKEGNEDGATADVVVLEKQSGVFMRDREMATIANESLLQFPSF